MHILIDVRTESLSDIPYLHYAHLWADIWRSYHPHDVITFLAHEGDTIECYECVRVSRHWTLFPKRLAHHDHGPDRVVSFSRLPPYDTSIPHIIHLSDLTPLLYPSRPLGAIEHRLRHYEYKKSFSVARHIIIPHLDVGMGASEIIRVDESKMSVIPYLSPVDQELMRHRTILPHGIYGSYYITEGTPGDEWRPLELLETYGHAVHRLEEHTKLIILGDLAGSMGSIMTMIRTLDLLDHVKIVGTLSREERSLLYAHATGWIYAGSYYSRGPSVALASGYGVPLIFSDIAGLREYRGRYFHPNHIDRLPDLLMRPEEKGDTISTASNNTIMGVYRRLLAE